MDDNLPLVVAMTGASGAPFAVRLLRVLCQAGRSVHLTISPSATQVIREELGLSISVSRFDPTVFGDLGPGELTYHHHEDFSAGIASGSFRTAGMVVAPCSMSTLGSIAHGITPNLITRAADVHLKERRKLILVPRETPLSLIHLENMVAVTRAGAIVLPAMPGWYHRPTSLDDVVDFVVSRICDQLGVEIALTKRWGGSSLMPKTVLITGASSGIGAGIARALIALNQGHRLALTARRAESLERIAAEAAAKGCEALVIADDLADPEAPKRIIDATLARFGRLDVVINNAGLGLPQPFAKADPVEMARQIQVNLTAPVVLTRLALESLIASKGTIINVGSSITCVANPIFGVYGATKAGLAYWNDALRREMRIRGVKVCLVEPGPVATEFFDAVASRFPGHESKGGSFTSAELGSVEKFREFAAIDPPPAWMSAKVDDVAARIVRLIDHPKRRISVLRRVVWPFRAIGLLIQTFPILGDLAIGRMVSRMEGPNAQNGR